MHQDKEQALIDDICFKMELIFHQYLVLEGSSFRMIMKNGGIRTPWLTIKWKELIEEGTKAVSHIVVEGCENLYSQSLRFCIRNLFTLSCGVNSDNWTDQEFFLFDVEFQYNGCYYSTLVQNPAFIRKHQLHS